MDISKQLLVGESISHAKKKIIKPIELGKFPSRKIMWYAITTTFEEDNLFYILSGSEFRHPLYHRVKDEGSPLERRLKILGICGSKKEALAMIQDIVQKSVDSNTVMDLKRVIHTW
ncbi:MAG: hypothetical protein Q4E53_09265 [Eubacteriales bacterium]|nr:hypothetical protein [Eubacteriales bacterium]